MAFCKCCGPKLEEGEVCNCRQEISAETPAAALGMVQLPKGQAHIHLA